MTRAMLSLHRFSVMHVRRMGSKLAQVGLLVGGQAVHGLEDLQTAKVLRDKCVVNLLVMGTDTYANWEGVKDAATGRQRIRVVQLGMDDDFMKTRKV